jgi:hypothetical protein
MKRGEPVTHRTSARAIRSGWAFCLDISARWQCVNLDVDVAVTLYAADRFVVIIQLEERSGVPRSGAGTRIGVDVEMVVAKTPRSQEVGEIWSEMVTLGVDGTDKKGNDLNADANGKEPKNQANRGEKQPKANETQRKQHTTLTITVIAPPHSNSRMTRPLAFGWDVYIGLEHLIPTSARTHSTLMTFHTILPSAEARTPPSRGSPAWTLLRERPGMVPVEVVDVGKLAAKCFKRDGEVFMHRLAAVGFQKEE